MPTRAWISIVVALAVSATIAIVVVSSLVRGTPIDGDTLGSVVGGVSAGTAITSLLLTLFDRRLWRARALHALLPDAQPVLHGTWAIHLLADQRQNPEEPLDLDGFLLIRQRYAAVTTRILYEDGAARSTVASMHQDQHTWQLWFSYDFQPYQGGVPERRRGAVELAVLVHPELRLRGHWWNERGDFGSLESQQFLPGELIDDFNVAKARVEREHYV